MIFSDSEDVEFIKPEVFSGKSDMGQRMKDKPTASGIFRLVFVSLIRLVFVSLILQAPPPHKQKLTSMLNPR